MTADIRALWARLAACCLAIGGLVCLAGAGPDQDKKLTPEQQIQEQAGAFVAAFNKGDAGKVANCWTKEGEYLNEAGQRFLGREAIEEQYKTFFAANPGAKISLAIDSIRLVGDNVAIEDGRATVTTKSGTDSQSKYMAVHVKEDGQWLMSSVRDSQIQRPSTHPHLADLEFLVGAWEAEHRGVSVQVACQWIANNNFLERTFTVTDNGHPVGSNKELIGWDPQTGAIKSWSFSSDGSTSTGNWTPHEVGWMIETSGVMPSGLPTSAVNVLSYVDEDTLAWKSLRRMHGDQQLPDTNEVLLKRAKASKK